MPFDHEVNHAERLVVVRGRGACTLAEWYDSFRRLLDNAELKPSYHLMFVIDEITDGVSAEEMVDIVRLFRLLRDRFTGRKAIVTSRPGRLSTVTMIALVASGGDQVEAFSTEAAGRAWLLTT